MASFRILGNSPAMAYLSCRLIEEGHEVHWWTSGYLAQLRPLRLRSDVLEGLIELFRRNSCDAGFVTRAPSLNAWAALKDGGDVHRNWSEMDEGFEDRWIEGVDLFKALKGVALSLGCPIRELQGSIPDPLTHLNDSTFLVTDMCSSELRLWPMMRREDRNLRAQRALSTRSLWLPRFDGDQNISLRGLLASSWKGTRMILEPHPKRGCVLTLSSSHAYSVEQTLKDILNPKVIGLSGLRALFLLNGQSFSEERIRQNIGFSEESFPMALKIGRSIGHFCPTTNIQDDWGLRNAEDLVLHCEKLESTDSLVPLQFVVEWNRKLQSRFKSELRRQAIWEEWLLGKSWGRMLVRASRYLPKTLRNRLQAPV
jgi:hypothetical protein